MISQNDERYQFSIKFFCISIINNKNNYISFLSLPFFFRILQINIIYKNVYLNVFK